MLVGGGGGREGVAGLQALRQSVSQSVQPDIAHRPIAKETAGHGCSRAVVTNVALEEGVPQRADDEVVGRRRATGSGVAAPEAAMLLTVTEPDEGGELGGGSTG